MFIFSLFIFIGSLGWLYCEPGWEPGLFALSSFSVVIFSENHVRDFIKRKLRNFKSLNIPISNGEILVNDEKLMAVLRPLCLGVNLEINITNLEDDALEKHANKKVLDENEKYYLLAQIDRRKERIRLSSEGIMQITMLYRKGFIRCGIEMLPSIVRRYINIVYPPTPNSPSFIERHREQAFDLYSNSVTKGEISFIADIPHIETQEILKKLEVKSTQDMGIPYMYSALQVPEVILCKYIVPAQILYGLTTHISEIENDNFWALHNWAIGPH